ncbi:hypothetical protein E2C01_084055 [Portunus trituberculatus]|uniref:Uncharacterized protein n=1 Tax=Portunus trituberculatus TaxID=210409 RepID=A0A5B7IUA0_PORTR|nr:hypothetical protein [Portunus trituberculatus]
MAFALSCHPRRAAPPISPPRTAIRLRQSPCIHRLHAPRSSITLPRRYTRKHVFTPEVVKEGSQQGER